MECLSLLWLLRESGCIHDLFSATEQERVLERLRRTNIAESCGKKNFTVFLRALQGVSCGQKVNCLKILI